MIFFPFATLENEMESHQLKARGVEIGKSMIFYVDSVPRDKIHMIQRIFSADICN